MSKFQVDQVSKKRRQDAIRTYVDNRNPQTQGMIVNHLKTQGIHVSQATVSRDLKEMGYEKATGGGFALKDEAEANLRRQRLAAAFHENGKKVIPEVSIFAIRSKPGFARSLCVLIEEMYGDEIVGTIAGEDTAIILTGPRKERIVTDLESLLETLPSTHAP